MQKLTQEDIESRLGASDDWTEINESIQRTFQFDDFKASMSFVNTCADHAEAVQHHPDMLIRYNKVTLTLSTHDAGGITEKDFEFASFADDHS